MGPEAGTRPQAPGPDAVGRPAQQPCGPRVHVCVCARAHVCKCADELQQRPMWAPPLLPAQCWPGRALPPCPRRRRAEEPEGPRPEGVRAGVRPPRGLRKPEERGTGLMTWEPPGCSQEQASSFLFVQSVSPAVTRAEWRPAWSRPLPGPGPGLLVAVPCPLPWVQLVRPRGEGPHPYCHFVWDLHA